MAGDTLEEMLAIEERRSQRQKEGRISGADALRQYGGRLSERDTGLPPPPSDTGGGILGLIRGLLSGGAPQVDPREQRRKLEELRLQNELKRMGLQ